MTIEEAIKYCEQKMEDEMIYAESARHLDEKYGNKTDLYSINCYHHKKSAEIHRQLSEWLRELKQLREQLREQPEIIRCGECKNMEVDPIFHDCWCNGKKVWITHFCGYAKRRTDED